MLTSIRTPTVLSVIELFGLTWQEPQALNGAFLSMAIRVMFQPLSGVIVEVLHGVGAIHQH